MPREYTAWHNAKRRCHDPKNCHYHRYGGRGITMCDEWRDDFAAFYAHMGPCPDGYTLDRIDNDKGYERGNCRWATPRQQALNRDNKALWDQIRKRRPLKKNSVPADALSEIRKELVPGDKRFGVSALARKYGYDHITLRRALGMMR